MTVATASNLELHVLIEAGEAKSKGSAETVSA